MKQPTRGWWRDFDNAVRAADLDTAESMVRKWTTALQTPLAEGEASKFVPTAEEITRRDIALTEAAHDLLVACEMEDHNEGIFKGKWQKGAKAWSGEYITRTRTDAMARIKALTEPLSMNQVRP